MDTRRQNACREQGRNNTGLALQDAGFTFLQYPASVGPGRPDLPWLVPGIDHKDLLLDCQELRQFCSGLPL